MTQHEGSLKDTFRDWLVSNRPELYEEWGKSPAEWMDLPEWAMAMHPQVVDEYFGLEVMADEG